MIRAKWLLSLTAVALLLAGGAKSAPAAERNLILATTTSTQDSGLLDALLPVFEKESGYVVKTIAVGSGQAMAMGQKGEADLLLVHSPDAETKFMADGFGIARHLVMHNDFVVLGPPEDPAGVKGEKTAAEAFKKIAASGALFLSRGDNSGTHSKEKALWKASQLSPDGLKWYQQTGLGMGQTLSVASDKNGYTLADRGTWLALRKNLSLAVLVEGEKNLLNVYHVIGVDPARWPRVNAEGARAFGDFLVSSEAQAIIGIFGADKYGQPLFFPDAGKKEEELGR